MTTRSLASLTAVLLLASPAAAVDDLTGSWEAKLNCSGIDSGATGKQKTETTIDIVDLGGGEILFDMGAYPTGQAFVISETAKPERGVVSGLTCEFDADAQNGLLLRAAVKTKPGQADATLKGILVIFEAENVESAVCKLNAKRVSTEGTKLVGCAPKL
jgi:hypothetical protein